MYYYSALRSLIAASNGIPPSISKKTYLNVLCKFAVALFTRDSVSLTFIILAYQLLCLHTTTTLTEDNYSTVLSFLYIFGFSSSSYYADSHSAATNSITRCSHHCLRLELMPRLTSGDASIVSSEVLLSAFGFNFVFVSFESLPLSDCY